MAEIVRGNFGTQVSGKKSEKKLTEAEKNGLLQALQRANDPISLAMAAASALAGITGTEKLIDENEFVKILVIQSHLTSLKGYTYDPESIALRRKSLRDETDERLAEIIKTSGPQNWNVHPSYYHAVIQEFKSRQGQNY